MFILRYWSVSWEGVRDGFIGDFKGCGRGCVGCGLCDFVFFFIRRSVFFVGRSFFFRSSFICGIIVDLIERFDVLIGRRKIYF